MTCLKIPRTYLTLGVQAFHLSVRVNVLRSHKIPLLGGLGRVSLLASAGISFAEFGFCVIHCFIWS